MDQNVRLVKGFQESIGFIELRGRLGLVCRIVAILWSTTRAVSDLVRSVQCSSRVTCVTVTVARLGEARGHH